MTLVQTKISRFCVLAKIELFRDRCALEMGGLPGNQMGSCIPQNHGYIFYLISIYYQLGKSIRSKKYKMMRNHKEVP